MSNTLPNCWEIINCGREKGGDKEDELGECIASKEELGHSCWAIAGTLCDGEVQGTMAQKIGYCSSCKVHKLYNRSLGEKGQEVIDLHPEEHAKYTKMLLQNSGQI